MTTTSPAAPTAVRVTTVIAVVIVAAVAAVVSYSHMTELAHRAGEAWRSWLIPISVDGLIVAASMVLLTRHRAAQPGGLLAWGSLSVGVVASLAANMADARPEVTSVLVAGWAPVAFAAAFHLLLQQRRAENTARPLDRTGPVVATEPTGSVRSNTAALTPLATGDQVSTMRTTSAPGPFPPSGPVPLQDQSAPHPVAQRFDTVTAPQGGSTSQGNDQVTPAVASVPDQRSPVSPAASPSPAPAGDLVDLVRPLVAEGLGRQAIATRLEITPHQARQAIATVKSERPTLRAVATGGTR